jgi:hypothetical protein
MIEEHPMRYEYSKVSLPYAPEGSLPASPATAPGAVPGVPALVDVDVVSHGILGSVLTLSVPPQVPGVNSALLEVRAYLLPEADPLPTTAPELIANPNNYPFAIAGVGNFQAAGGVAALNLPTVTGGPFLGQVVLGFAT